MKSASVGRNASYRDPLVEVTIRPSDWPMRSSCARRSRRGVDSPPSLRVTRYHRFLVSMSNVVTHGERTAHAGTSWSAPERPGRQGRMTGGAEAHGDGAVGVDDLVAGVGQGAAGPLDEPADASAEAGAPQVGQAMSSSCSASASGQLLGRVGQEAEVEVGASRPGDCSSMASSAS